MNFKRLLCALLCVLMVVAVPVCAEEDKDARIAELEAQVAELEARVAAYHQKEIVASFDGGEVSLEDAEALYAQYENMYSQYGISLADYGMEGMVREQVVSSLAEDAIIYHMAERLGLGVTDEAKAQFETEATTTYEENVRMYYENYFKDKYEDETEGLAAVATELNAVGYTYESVLRKLIEAYLREQVYKYVTKDVAVTDEDVQATYDELVANDKASYTESAYSFENAYNGGASIYYTPEGYRVVKHILFRFNDDQAATYNKLSTKLEELEAEQIANAKAAEEPADTPAEEPADTPAEEPAEAPAEEPAETPAEESAEAPAEESAEAPVEETAEAPAEESAEAPAEESAEAPAEESAETAAGLDAEVDAALEEPRRADSEIQADIEEVNRQLDALYLELLPEAEAAAARFNGGEDIDALIAELSADSMPKQGYAVSTTADISSQMWDAAFTEGALSIAEIGGLSEPVRGMYGIHLIYYASDLTPGAVALEDVRDAVESAALENKLSRTYSEQLEAWKTELNLVTYPENMA